MIKFFKGFSLAFNMLSIIPFFKTHDFFKGINGYAVMSYPLVGLILGFILWGIHSLLAPFIPSSHLGIIIFSMWVLITGALHLDGFCDTVDGLFVPKEKALKVMKDPHNGGMGMIFGGVFLILKASSLAAFNAFYLLPVILMLSRFNASLAIYLYPYLNKNGIGSLAKKEFNHNLFFITTLYTIIIGMWVSWSLVVISILVLLLSKYFFLKRYGGFTGDIYGFVIELTELTLLNVIIIGLT